MNEQKKCEWMVYVSCTTFNHATYIVDAMNGFTIQETNFPYVCAIIDDASTDGEQEVIKNYLDEHFALGDKSVARYENTDDYVLTFARHKTNLNCYFAVLFLKYNHYSIKKSKVPYISQWRDNAKYIALCEGDDYWIDSHKLQMQADILDSKPDSGMCYTAYRFLYTEDGRYKDIYTMPNILHDDSFKWDLLTFKVQIGTATVLIRQSLYNYIYKECADDFSGFMMGDIQTWFNCARLSNVSYIPVVTEIYRKHKGSATALNDNLRKLKFENNMMKMRMHLTKKYDAPKEVINVIRKEMSLKLITTALSIEQYQEALSINEEYLFDNLFVKNIIRTAHFFRLKRVKGLNIIICSIKLQ